MSPSWKPSTSKAPLKMLPIQKLPTDLLAKEVLSKYLMYPVGKNASKIFRTTRGHGRDGGSVRPTMLEKQFQKVVPLLSDQECLEAIYSKYPFLPNQEEMGIEYIHIKKQPFEKFDRDCVEMNFPLQIGRRCFRIVYFRPVLEKIFNTESMNLKTKEGKKKFMAALEGIKDTFRFSSTSKQHVWYRLIILLDRLYEFLNETENYS